MESEEYELMAATEDHMWWFVGLHDWMLDRIEKLSIPSDAMVLDCGAGTGGFAKKLVARLPRLNLVALDIDADAIRYFRRKSSRPIVRGTVNSLAFEHETFDLIVASDVLYHSAVDEDHAMRELHRCLKVGGSLLLNLPAYNWMRSSHDDRVHTARRYTAGAAAMKLQSAGFDVREATYRNSLLFPIMALWRLTIGRFSRASDVEEFPAWQEFVFRSAITLENALARRGIRFPFGGSVYVQAVKQ